jgi:hypothetical protein
LFDLCGQLAWPDDGHHEQKLFEGHTEMTKSSLAKEQGVKIEEFVADGYRKGRRRRRDRKLRAVRLLRLLSLARSSVLSTDPFLTAWNRKLLASWNIRATSRRAGAATIHSLCTKCPSERRVSGDDKNDGGTPTPKQGESLEKFERLRRRRKLASLHKGAMHRRYPKISRVKGLSRTPSPPARITAAQPGPSN